MQNKDSLGDRMKAFENSYRAYLLPRMPIILRLDGVAFHTLTKQLKLKKPFDEKFSDCMVKTANFVFTRIQGAKLCYVASDEISLFLNPYEHYNTDTWFGGNIQKMVSVSAAMATESFGIFKQDAFGDAPVAYFDSRAFVLPREEVYNYFLWRANDATRNAISGYARYKFGHAACHKVSTGDMLNMIPKEEWDTVSKVYKYGTLFFEDKQSSDYLSTNIIEISKIIHTMGE